MNVGSDVWVAEAIPIRLVPLAAAALALLFALPAGADGCTPTTTPAEIDTGNIRGTGIGAEEPARIYVDILIGLPELCCEEVWVYVEANGIDGLQRQDESWDDTCGGQIAGDMLVV